MSTDGPGPMRTVGNVSKGVDVRSLGERVRVFIGTEPKTEIARKVLECSIRRRTNADVEFVPMIGKEWQYDHSEFKVGTGFSLRRWMIPAYCGWHGRAIYLDADQIVFSDIWDLWCQPDYRPEKGRAAWMTYQPSKFSKEPHPNSSVMVIDCAAAAQQEWFHLDRVLAYLKAHPSQKAYAGLMYPNWMKPEPGRIPNEWNSLNVFVEGKTKLLHYTKEPEQPWYVPDHPFAMKWKLEFQIAMTLGYITEDEVRDAVSKFGIQEDWRTTNGLHPEYLNFIPKKSKKGAA